MKKIYKYIGLFIIMVFSFYYTDKIVLVVQKSNPIMKEIERSKKEKDVNPVNAIIEGNKIIPGKNGLNINEAKSFSLMKSFGTFNSYYLIYDQKKPKISLEDNKDKIIYSGNLSNKQISIIVENDEKLISYFKNINVNILNNNDIYDKKNSDLCYISSLDIEKLCKKEDKYLIKTDLILTNDSVFDIKKRIKNGSIILIKKDTNIETVNTVLSQAQFKGLKIVYLSDLISEENHNS